MRKRVEVARREVNAGGCVCVRVSDGEGSEGLNVCAGAGGGERVLNEVHATRRPGRFDAPLDRHTTPPNEQTCNSNDEDFGFNASFVPQCLYLGAIVRSLPLPNACKVWLRASLDSHGQLPHKSCVMLTRQGTQIGSLYTCTYLHHLLERRDCIHWCAKTGKNS